jgi:FtsP/CotA-like multicopper oxidase with cupredoxin domain
MVAFTFQCTILRWRIWAHDVRILERFQTKANDFDSIYGPQTAAYDIDLGPVMLNDYYHADYYSILENVVGTNLGLIRPFSDNNLINGKNSYNCSLAPSGTACTPNAGYSKFNFQTGKTHRLRLINAGSEAVQKFSIDQHTLTVIAVDFVPIVPYTTTIATLAIGQRMEVLVTANLPANSSVWMRSDLSCSLDHQPNALAMVYYPSANHTGVPTSTAYIDTTNPCANDPLTSMVPYFAQSVGNPATTTEIDINFLINATGNFLWTMNNSSFRVDYNSPVLFAAAQGNDSYPYSPQWNVYNFGTNTSIRLLVKNLTPAAHPMHLHGHNFQILSEGSGAWDGTIVNPSNPTRRDVHLLQAGGYMVLQFNADNPGVWPFHCHIAWHVSSGLYVNVLERPDLIPSQVKIPSNVQNTCTQWNAITNQAVVDQIDSGV